MLLTTHYKPLILFKNVKELPAPHAAASGSCLNSHPSTFNPSKGMDHALRESLDTRFGTLKGHSALLTFNKAYSHLIVK